MTNPQRRLWLCLCTPLLLSGCLGDLLPFSQKKDYAINGAARDPDLNDYLKTILDERTAAKLEKTDPETDARRESYRENSIVSELEKGLRAKGYYNGKVTYIDDAAKPLTGKYDIEAGQKYTISSVTVTPPEYAALFNRRHVDAGKPLDAQHVLDAQSALAVRAQKGHCYFNFNITNAVTLDNANATGALTLTVAAGPEAKFGPITFTGETSARQSYLRKLARWKEGACYRPERIERLKTRFLETGLFTRAAAVIPDAPLPDGSVPVEIRLADRAHRTVRAGVNYYTDEGPGALLGWEHRNFFGAAEKLSVDLGISGLKQSLDVELQKPYFLRNDQTLYLNSALRRQDTDAYEEVAANLGAGIDRRFSKRLNGSTGLALTLSRISEKNELNEEDRVFGLVSLPTSLTYDNRDDALNPTEGWNITGGVTPFADVLGESQPFLKTQITASTYFSFDRESRYILAMKAGFGSILGTDNFNIPPTERFYAGGGGSVRGFAYQSIGPKDSDNNPLGGRSIVTSSTEFRTRFTEKIGGVAFVDAGSVSDQVYPDMDQLAIGAGVGFRYYTDFGPLRFDIALPMTQKDETDESFQFYLSIGQAF